MLRHSVPLPRTVVHCIELGIVMAEPPTLTKLTVDELLPMAEEGNAAAQLELGYRYYTGMDPAVTKDLPRSTSYFEQAAPAGHPDAQFELGVRFEKGWGVDKDPALALEWFVRIKNRLKG